MLITRTGHRILILLAVAAVSLLLAFSAGCGGSAVSRAPATAVPTAPASSAAPPSPYHYSFIVCGDPQNNYEVLGPILEAAKSVDFLIIAGDLTGSGTKTEFANFKAFIDASGVKYYCVPGNHDVAVSPSEGNYQAYMGAPHQSFDHKNSHFVLIDNSSPKLGFYPAEQQWVKADLQAARAKGFDHIIAVAHVAPGLPYSSNPKEIDVAGITNNEELTPVLADGGVEELFCGHLHVYEEYKERSMTVTITGGAGAPLHTANSYFHYVLVEVNGKQITQKVVRI